MKLFRYAIIALLVPLCVLLALGSRRPSNARDWSPDQALPPRADFRGDKVTVRGLRDASYESAQRYEVRLYERTFDLRELQSVDYAVELFDWWRGPAHVLLSFGFKGGDRLVISVEARKERGESYSPFKGMLRGFELMYVAGAERDLIGLRTHVRRHPVYLYPIRVEPRQARALLESMLRRADALAEAPEFYHTLTNNCATNIARHLRELFPGSVPRSLRLMLPGYSDRLAYDLGLLGDALPLAELRLRHRIDEKARGCALDSGYSRCLRSS